MRNPERINEFMAVLKRVWEIYPDLRFNQLLHALQFEYNEYKGGGYYKVLWEKDVYERGAITSYQKHLEVDLFYVEDENFLEFLKKKLDTFTK